MRLVQIETHDELKQSHQQWVEEALKQSKIVRESKWTQSIAAGDKSFLNKSNNGWEFGPKAVRFINVMMNISYVKDRPFMVIGLTRSMKINSLGN